MREAIHFLIGWKDGKPEIIARFDYDDFESAMKAWRETKGYSGIEIATTVYGG